MDTLICDEEIIVLPEPIEKFKKVLGRKSSEPSIITVSSYQNMIHHYNQLHLTHIEEKDKTVKFRLNQEIDKLSEWIKMFKKELK